MSTDNDNKKNSNLPISDINVALPSNWKEILEDFYIEFDTEITNGDFKNRMILEYNKWLAKHYNMPSRNER